MAFDGETCAAASVRSGKVVVVGVPEDHAPLKCGGMALLRVFQGPVEIAGFRPHLGVYYPVFSPTWTSVLTIKNASSSTTSNTNANANTNSDPSSSSLLNEDYQASFSDTSLKLLKLRCPQVCVELEIEEEHGADAKAKEIAASFPIVLILRSLPLTYGNLQSFYGPGAPAGARGCTEWILPGFRFLTPKTNITSSSSKRNSSDDNETAKTLVGRSHEHKSSDQIVSELWCTESFRTLEITVSWLRVADEIMSQTSAKSSQHQSSKVVVCGAKGVGKSTFCRYLVNKLLQVFPIVAFLDTDLGQPELTLPGQVSLHLLTDPLLGPGVTHFHEPLRSFFCGNTNPGHDPCHYMTSVQHLVRLYENKYASLNGKLWIPLVINTDGWIKSMGHDLLCDLIQKTHPDHVVQLLGVTRSQQFDLPIGSPACSSASKRAWTIHHLTPWMASTSAVASSLASAATTTFVGKMQQPPRSSKEMRRYRFHFYFLSNQPVASSTVGDLVLASPSRREEEIAVQLSKVPTIDVMFDQVDVMFAGGICSVAPSQLLAALNASVVGLCINPKRPCVVSSKLQSQSHVKFNSEVPEHSEVHEDQELEHDETPVNALRAPRILLQGSSNNNVEDSSGLFPCVGVALIRAIDVQRGVLQLITPVDASLVGHVNVLVLGHFQSLSTVLVSASERFVETPYVVTNVLTGDGTGGSIMKSRNSLKRKRDDKK